VNIGVMAAVYLAVLGLYRAPVHWSLAQAIELIFVELLLVTALALFFSTFSTATLSAIFTLGLFVIGHLTSDLRGLAGAGRSEWLQAIVGAVYYLCPNLELLNIKGQAALGVPVSAWYQLSASAYGLLYTAVVLAGACIVFSRRDF
jgi:ABC-type transport system involved in multi-copper enzyme maturation permease subunit